ncbi:MAG TPA: STAS domain-containing protein [Chitinophagaceae bacterium]
MKVKINTKEKFHVITSEDNVLTANMTEELAQMLLPYLKSEIKNVVLKLGMVNKIDKSVAETILNLQQTFYDNNISFVICELQKPVEDFLDQLELLDVLNVTNTESEAWDIVQMEEIEREYMD